MPVTAKLSRKFYERLGDDIAGELVDWFNAVDSTYQTQLREQNDLNWERYKAFVDARIAEFRREVEASIAREVKALRSEISDLRAEMIKWMFLFWVAQVATIGGLLVVILRLR